MKNLKNNIEQTCIEFGKYVANNYAPQTPVDIIKGMWGHFQEQQAKEVMDILDDIQSNDKSDDLYTIDGLDDNGIGEPVCEDLEDAITLADRYNEYLDSFRQLNGEHKCMMTFIEYVDACKDDKPKGDDFNKHFGSTQDKINHEILQLIADNNALDDERWKKYEDVLMEIYNICKLLDERIDDNHSLIKLTNTMVSANGIALNNVEKDLESNDSQPDVKENLTTDYSKTMTAEEFYKDHFGHTSQHVSMDKIFVCMELYAIHKKTAEKKHTTRTGGLGETGPRN